MREEIIIDVQINESDVKQKLVEVTGAMNDLKASNVALKKELKDLEKSGTGTAEQFADLNLKIAENNQSIKTLSVSEKALQQQLTGTAESSNQLGDSFKEQSKLLANLKNQYSSLTAEQRNTEGGKAMKAQIDALDKSVKGADASLGNFQRNVGNYPILGKYGETAQQVGGLFEGGFSAGIKKATTSVVQFGKMLLTTPIGWIAAAIGIAVAAFNKLVEAFKKNDEAGTRLQQAMAQLKPIGEAISFVFDKLAVVTAKLIQGFMGAVTWVLKLIPAYRESAKAAEDLVLAQDKLEETERNYTVNSARRNLTIAELRKKERSDVSLTAQQRLDLLKQIDDLEKQNLADKLKIDKQKLDNLKAVAKQEKDTSDETANAIAQAEAQLFNSRTAYFEGTTRMAARAAAAEKELAAENKRRADEEKQRLKELAEARKQARQTEQNEVRAAEDLALSILQDGAEKEKKIIELNATRAIFDLNKRLATEKDLTVTARNGIKEQIKLIELKMYSDIKTIDDLASKERFEKEKEKEEQRLQAIADAKQRENDLLAADFDLKLLMEDNYYNELLLKAGENGNALAKIELDQAIQRSETLKSMDAATKAALYQNEAQYAADVIAAEQAVQDAQRNTTEQGLRNIDNQQQMIDAYGKGLSDLMTSIAGDDANMMKFVKAIAAAQAAANLGLAISKAVAAGAGNPLTLAVNVGAVLSAMAGVITSIKSISEVKPPKFATGGIVPGFGTGDTVKAMLTPGEMILNADQQARLFELANNRTITGTGIDYDLLGRTIAASVASLPAPVLDYKEFTDFQQLTTRIKERASI